MPAMAATNTIHVISTQEACNIDGNDNKTTQNDSEHEKDSRNTWVIKNFELKESNSSSDPTIKEKEDSEVLNNERMHSITSTESLNSIAQSRASQSTIVNPIRLSSDLTITVTEVSNYD
ncbi:2859_t:CDS:1 [Acaulospora colombiana]|uniref:2859_t:CDS:1 n=1 Tax=Acaulospora colombiana TaxID=27376 RepID=A0ACA9NEL8_9GLOM|nr:2859_t:CDS:1 [Acaulospora colombiana]